MRESGSSGGSPGRRPAGAAASQLGKSSSRCYAAPSGSQKKQVKNVDQIE